VNEKKADYNERRKLIDDMLSLLYDIRYPSLPKAA